MGKKRPISHRLKASFEKLTRKCMKSRLHKVLAGLAELKRR